MYKYHCSKFAIYLNNIFLVCFRMIAYVREGLDQEPSCSSTPTVVTDKYPVQKKTGRVLTLLIEDLS